MSELGGEKIDIVDHSSGSKSFVVVGVSVLQETRVEMAVILSNPLVVLVDGLM